MATKLGLLLILIISSSFFSFISVAGSKLDSPSQISWWCNQTPYPDQCNYFMSHDPRHFAPKQKSDFRKMVIQVALDRALQAASITKNLGPKCRNRREMAAWADCVTLYETTIHQLNRTLDPREECTDLDAQTWLSAALTNLETCRNGCFELGVADHLLPLMPSNVSELVSDSLALKNGSALLDADAQADDGGFPSWVKPGDRKLLEPDSVVTPDLVVAQDGSGDHVTIKAALLAAAASKGVGGRSIIQVKAGVYNEHLDVTNDNVMLVGEGLGVTVITGSRSAGGGYTTFSSATVGNILIKLSTVVLVLSSTKIKV